MNFFYRVQFLICILLNYLIKILSVMNSFLELCFYLFIFFYEWYSEIFIIIKKEES